MSMFTINDIDAGDYLQRVAFGHIALEEAGLGLSTISDVTLRDTAVVLEWLVRTKGASMADKLEVCRQALEFASKMCGKDTEAILHVKVPMTAEEMRSPGALETLAQIAEDLRAMVPAQV